MDVLTDRGLWGLKNAGAGCAPAHSAHRANHANTAAFRDGRHVDFARRIWREAVPAAGTLAHTYLKGRHLHEPPPGSLRFHGGLRHPEARGRLPGMVAAVTVWPDRDVRAVHRTFLKPGGEGKAAVSPPKMTLGPLAGGAVRLAPLGPCLLIGEGIESTLSAMAVFDLSGWAALSTGGLRGVCVPPPDLVPDIVIAADHDQPGLSAARGLAARLHALGHRVRLACPPDEGADYNDVLRGAG
ncbi:DUF7146 domain-containing protein [Roseospira navarrensis]